MKIFDYSELIRVINNVEIREKREENIKNMKIEEKYKMVEAKLISSGILEDWFNLKQVCRKANVRLCVAYRGESSIGIVTGRKNYAYCDIYADNGRIQTCMSSGSHWSDYYGFIYDKESHRLVWDTTHTTSYSNFHGFGPNREVEKHLTRIKMMEIFMETYEDYREFQLKKIEEVFKGRIKPSDLLK